MPDCAVKRILVTGSRHLTDLDLVHAALSEARWDLGPGLMVVHGGARGADRIAATLAAGLGLEVEAWPADWAGHGRAAGFIRNQAMVDAGAVRCLAFLTAHACRGTRHCAGRAAAAGIPVCWYEQGGAR
jgi:YspA, cpYpsA-related SLOG family